MRSGRRAAARAWRATCSPMFYRPLGRPALPPASLSGRPLQPSFERPGLAASAIESDRSLRAGVAVDVVGFLVGLGRPGRLLHDVCLHVIDDGWLAGPVVRLDIV